MSKIIGGPLSADVVSQLNLRRDKYGLQSGRTNEDLQYLNSKTGWVKLTSGVNIKGESKWAREYILIGGTINRFGDETYSTFGGKTGKGFRPMPGINGVQVRSTGKFGTLKEATITFNCWDVDQLSNLEMLYMRPGFTALLEWGHSLYYTSPTNLVKIPSTVTKIFPQTTTNSEGKSVTSQAGKQGIYDEIEELRESSKYNYDGIFGFIKNFSWSFRPDGGYDCTTTIVSIGELIESLTVDTDVASNTTDNSPAASATNVKPATMIENVMKVLIDSPSAIDISTKFPEFWQKYKEVNTGDDTLKIVYKQGITVKNTSTETTAGDAGNFSWLSLKHLCRVINAAILIDNTEKNIIRLNTEFTRTSKFKTNSKHVSSDPRVCMIATDSVDYWYANLPIATGAVDIIREQIDGDRDSILNIYVNVHLVAEVMTSLRDQPKESRTLVNMIQPILQKINDALGGVNNLDLHYEEEKFTYYIVDRQLESSEENTKNLPTLNITGLKSTVSQFNFTTKLSPAITTMLAISAQASAADVGLEAEALLAWNNGLKDRVISQRKQRTKEQDQETITAERQKAQDDREVTIMQGFTSFWRDSQYIKDQIDAARTAYAQYATTLTQFVGKDSTPAGIIPFEVSIQMDGIGGIKQGQAFKINEGIMPSNYNGVVGFMVTGIDHDISNNRWVTNLKAQTIIIGKRTSKVAAPVQESKGLPETKETKSPRPTGKATLEPGFLEAVKALEDKIGVERNAIYRIMKHESGLNPAIVNNIGCVGLIQFCPDISRGPTKRIGKQTYVLADLGKMTGLEQLKVVEEYYKPMIGKAKTIGDLYMYTFLPAAVGKPDDFVIGKKDAKTRVFGISQNSLYVQNRGFDGDNKGFYTVGDVKKRINKYPM